MAPTFFARPAELVARELLGCLLISVAEGERTSGRIVETEAYVGPHDPASHAAARIGRTARNESMFGAAGLAYVYRIYGIHWCLNTVTDRPDYPAAVLIRALEPMEGVETMLRRRARGQRALARRGLCSGPARLTAALAITGQLDGHPLDRPPLWIEPGEDLADVDVIRGPRIGITRATDWPLRYRQRDSVWVSRP